MKKIGLFILTLCLTLAMAGCSTYLNKSLTYNVDNGDSIKITLNAKDGFQLKDGTESGAGNFTILKDDVSLCIGGFSYGVDFESLKEFASSFDEYEDGFTENDNEYFFAYDGSKGMYYYEIMVDDSDTIVVLQGENFDDLTTCFGRITASCGEED